MREESVDVSVYFCFLILYLFSLVFFYKFVFSYWERKYFNGFCIFLKVDK